MGERWNDQVGEPTAQTPAMRRAREGTEWPPAPGEEDAPTVVDGRITHVSERSPYPTAPGYPMPYGNMYAPAPYGAYPPPQEQPREPSALAQPFPIWLTLAAPVVMLLTLGVAFTAEVFLLGSDWATGALAAALAALALAALTVIVLIVRVIAGRRALGMVALAALLALALTGGGLAGISQINPLRRAQARQFESSRQWQPAIDEYAQSGEKAPNAPDIARIYTEWGESLAGGGNYAGAVSKLTTVTQTYGQSGASVPRAKADLFKAYTTWIQSGATTLPFEQSLTFLASYAKDPACDATCQTTITNVSGQAHFQYGQQLLKANQFKPAITEFELVQSQYAQTQYAPQAHTGAAQAYLALAQQTLSQDCASAVPFYQALAKSYGDTDQGKQAKTKLAAPVPVTGTLSGFPKNPLPVMYLSLHINPSRYYASNEYHTNLNAASGKFSFGSVRPGAYFLTMLQTTSTQIIYSWYPNSFTVGPICAMDLGALRVLTLCGRRASAESIHAWMALVTREVHERGSQERGLAGMRGGARCCIRGRRWMS